MSEHKSTEDISKSPARAARSVTSTVSLVVAVVLTIATVIILLQNTIHTKIDVLVWNLDIAQGLSLLGAAACGAVIAISVGTVLRIRRALR